MKRLLTMLSVVLMIALTLTSCVGSGESIDALNAQIETLTKQLEDANAKIAALEAEKLTLSAEITSLNADIKVLEAEKATLVANKETLEAEKALLESEISELEAEIEKLEALLDGNSTALREEIAELEAQVDSLKAEVEALKNTKSELESDITDLNAQINSLNEENEELKALVEALRNCLYTREGDYIYFGEYPQTIKADDVTVTATTDSRGYYLGDDGNYYARVIADPRVSGYTFSTGASVTDGTEYYFKVEPIRWRILSEEDGVAFILCDSIIANVPYQSDYTYDSGSYYTTANGAPSGTYANNYKYSEVRAWLNATFYETAFNSLQQEIVLTTEVDNSAASTNSYGNETCWNNGVNDYACENTNDKIFLLSESEVTNDLYGFAAYSEYDTARRMLTSDYSRATGAYMSTSSDYYGNGWWWLRSPYCSYSYYARDIFNDGSARDYYNVYNTYVGVVPALRIRL